MSSSTSYWRRAWRHFKRNTLAVIGLWTALALVLIALLADVLANDTPYYMVYQGTQYFPLLQSGLDSLGIVTLPPELRHVDFSQLPAERTIFPPIPYRPNRINLLSPLPSPQRRTGWGRTSWDVMSWLVSFMGHVFRCPLVSWPWGLP